MGISAAEGSLLIRGTTPTPTIVFIGRVHFVQIKGVETQRSAEHYGW